MSLITGSEGGKITFLCFIFASGKHPDVPANEKHLCHMIKAGGSDRAERASIVFPELL